MLCFAYGSLMDAGQMRKTCPGAQVRHTPARLEGYEIDFRHHSHGWQGGAADIVVREGAAVFGCVWEIPEEEVADLDFREGVGSGAYRRLNVTVGVDDREVEVVTYEVVAKTATTLAPTAEYAKLMLGAARAGALPLEYQAAVRELIERAAGGA